MKLPTMHPRNIHLSNMHESHLLDMIKKIGGVILQLCIKASAAYCSIYEY